LDYRIETGERERIGAALTLDYRDTDNSVNFSFLYGRLKDDDIRIQQEIQLDDSSNTETFSLEAGRGRFSDANIERQIYFTPIREQTYALHLQGDHNINGGPW